MKPHLTFRNRSANPMAMKLLISLALGLSQASAAIIFSDDFSGGAGDLDGTTPDTGAVNWIASSLFNADGTTEQGAGSATLEFAPVDGFIYTLDASYRGLGLVGGPDNDWFALGFVNGQSTGSTLSDRFITTNVVGSAWMLIRGDQSLDPNAVAWSGTGALGAGNNGLLGLSVGIPLTPITSEIDMRIILDTTAGGGPTGWTATWSVKRAADSSYTVVRPAESLQSGATISAVGLARSNGGVTGTVESFSLTSAVPEPSSAALLGLGALALLRRRR